MRTVYVAVTMAVLATAGSACQATAQTAADEEMAWITDQDDDFFYLAYSVPESDHFAIAFACSPKDKKTFVALNEKQGGDVKAGDKFPMTLQIGDVRTTVQAETAFNASEEILRSVAPIESNDSIFVALNGVKPLEVTRAGKTMSFPLVEVSDRLHEFQQGCGLKK